MIRPRRKGAQCPNPGRALFLRRARLRRAGAWLLLAAALGLSLPDRAGAAPPAVRRGGSRPDASRLDVSRPGAAPGTPAAVAARPPRVVGTGGAGAAVPSQGAAAAAPHLAPGVLASFPQQIATYPSQGETRVPSTAVLWIAFDQPTQKSGSFSVADVDSIDAGHPNGTLLNLDVPGWSALGDTVFLYPSAPLVFGHQHGMKVNTIVATDGTISNDLPTVFFRVIPRTRLEPVSFQSANVTIALAPGVPTPAGVAVRESAGTEARFTSASATFLDPGGAPLDSAVERVSIRVPRNGVADLKLPVVLPPSLAAAAPGGRLSLRLAFYGTDETRSAVTYVVVLPVVVTPGIASTAVIESAVLEWPIHGAAIAAGDTILPRAVVTGSGTGPFRGAFWLDGELLAIEEGFLYSGRPTTVAMRGPLPTRRLGEHRLTFAVEGPQPVAARPVSFICVPPVRGVSEVPGAPGAGAGEGGGVGAPPPDSESTPPPAPRRLQASATLLGAGKSKFGREEGAGVAWGFGNARYDLGRGASLEATASLRFRADDPENGSARPEQMRLRLLSRRGTAEWSDAAPALADSAPLFMSAVPRRAAQGRLEAGGLGVVQGYVALDSRPVSAGGPIEARRPDIYAGRVTRALAGDRVELTAYGGYAHLDWSGIGGADSLTSASALLAAGTLPAGSHSVYGGMGRARLHRDWALLADAASVHYRDLPGEQVGRTRTGWRSELSGSVAGIRAMFQGFRYQPDMATALNPYALSNRVGGAAEASRGIGPWRFAAGFRSEQPAERVGLMPVVRADQLRFGGTLMLNPCSWVQPAFLRTTHRGAGTEYTENRIQGAFTRCEPRGGQTTARLDAATYRDPKAANARRRVYAASLVSTLRHAAGGATTLTLGYEEDIHEDLDRTDRTVQGTFETQWEAVPGRLLVTPYFAGSSRDYEARGTKETRLGGRLELAWLRFAHLGENALALAGRIERVNTDLPVSSSDTDAGVSLTWGQRFDW